MKSAHALAIALLTCTSSGVMAQNWGAVRVAPVATMALATTVASIVAASSTRLSSAITPPPPAHPVPVVVTPQICRWVTRPDGSAVQRCTY